jgi:hypothetical protein
LSSPPSEDVDAPDAEPGHEILVPAMKNNLAPPSTTPAAMEVVASLGITALGKLWEI